MIKDTAVVAQLFSNPRVHNPGGLHQVERSENCQKPRGSGRHPGARDEQRKANEITSAECPDGVQKISSKQTFCSLQPKRESLIHVSDCFGGTQSLMSLRAHAAVVSSRTGSSATQLRSPRSRSLQRPGEYLPARATPWPDVNEESDQRRESNCGRRIRQESPSWLNHAINCIKQGTAHLALMEETSIRDASSSQTAVLSYRHISHAG
ncbi:hypothetical protein VTK56DRAFT_9202 [Thermocarpiscus australiensis]